MKTRLFYSIRWKFILLFVFSGLLALAGLLFLLGIAYVLTGISDVFRDLLNFLSRTIGPVPIIVLTVGTLFFIFYFMLSQRSISYLEEISESLKQIAQGQFDVQIKYKSQDELGDLAENINTMADQLKQLIEEERNAERTKNELITSVSHDLRTPLTSVLGYLGLIANDKYRDEVELRYYIDVAYNKSQRLKKLIDDLFEFTRISGHGLRLVPAKVDLKELLEQLAEEFVPILDEAEMQYRLLVPREKVFVYVDGDMMVRVFENLISNAVRYGREGRYVDIELANDGLEAIVKVSNYGEPIPQSELPYIFEKFYRLEKSRSDQTGGTGLGLAIAKNIVELHSGKISAYSHQQKTVFEVKLKVLK